jgi:N-acetylglucosamine-6-phosphate deacetylase
MVRTAIAAKRSSRMLAITDGTAASGMPVGTRTRLGEQPIVAGPAAAYLDDGTLAGSTATMDRVFRTLVERIGVSLLDAAAMCATTPARELALVGYGVLAVDAPADVLVLDRNLTVVQTYVGGRLAYAAVNDAART